MGRPTDVRVSKPHPSPRFKDKIRLLCFRRGPQDATWAVEFRIDGKWTPRGGLSLGTTDWDEAVETARDKFAIATTGQRVARTYTASTPAEPKVDHPFSLYADRAIERLEKQAIEADAAVAGKGHNHKQLAGRVRTLKDRWRDTNITALSDQALNAWIEDHYRVEDADATVAKYGRQSRDAKRKVIWKKPGKNTLGNLDWALRHVWQEAVRDGIVAHNLRPKINKELGLDDEPRAFIDRAGVEAVARVMTDTWVKQPGDHHPDLKRTLRTYVASIACTGIRAGLEAKRILIGHVKITPRAITIYVVKRQGKHRLARTVVVYEGGNEFPIRRLLQEQIAWRRSQGATDRDYLFRWSDDGRPPLFRDALNTVLRMADAEFDPLTGEHRVAYSFRHFFATRLIELGHSVPVIAAWLGTSSDPIERHYNKFLIERYASDLSGVVPFVDPFPDPWRTPADIELDEQEARLNSIPVTV